MSKVIPITKKDRCLLPGCQFERHSEKGWEFCLPCTEATAKRFAAVTMSEDSLEHIMEWVNANAFKLVGVERLAMEERAKEGKDKYGREEND